MAEEGIVMQTGQPILGQASGKMTLAVPAGVNYISFLANNALSPITVSSGATGDWLAGVTVVPTSTTIGQIWLQDGASSANSALIVSAGTLADIKPFYVPLGIRSTKGGWQISTSAGAGVIVSGAF